MSNNDLDKYLDMTDDQIDSLLYDINLEKEVKSKRECINCKGTNLIFNPKESCLECEDCGVINEEVFDKNPEFENDENNSGSGARYGCPTNPFYPQSALGTKIKTKGFNKIDLLQRQSHMPYKEKSLMKVLEGIQKKCREHNITQPVLDSAKILYKNISECRHKSGNRKGKNHIMRCLNRRSMIAACVFFACKLQNELRSPKEIADIYDLELRNVNRGCKKFLDYIDMDQILNKLKSSQSFDFIKRFSEQLDMEDCDINLAYDISNNIHKLDLASTHEPPSVAAGCILLVVNLKNLNIPKKKISDMFRISDVTISKTYRRIFPFHKIIINNEVTNLILQKKKNIPKKEFNIKYEDLVIV